MLLPKMLGISMFAESGFGHIAITDVPLPYTEQKNPQMYAYLELIDGETPLYFEHIFV